MKLTVLATTLALAPACVDELDTGIDESEVWTEPNRRTFEHPLRIKSTINTTGTGMCMDVAGGYTAENTPIVQYPCHGGMNQRFYLNLVDFAPTHQIRSALDRRMCVGIRPGSQALALVTCDNAQGDANLNTRWRADEAVLRSTGPGITRFRHAPALAMCIDIPSGTSAHSQTLQAYGCHGGPNQQWEVTNL